MRSSFDPLILKKPCDVAGLFQSVVEIIPVAVR